MKREEKVKIVDEIIHYVLNGKIGVVAGMKEYAEVQLKDYKDNLINKLEEHHKKLFGRYSPDQFFDDESKAIHMVIDIIKFDS